MRTIQDLFKDIKAIKYKKNDIIPHPRIKKQIYYLKEGFIKVQKLIEGEKRILLVLEPGDLFPVTNQAQSPVKVMHFEAITDVKLLAIDSKTFFKKADTDIAVLKLVNEQLTKYLYTYIHRVETLEYPKVQNKLVARLVHFEKRFGKTTTHGTKINLPVTHEFIAASINSARENVSREITKLQKKKIISLKNGELIILNSKRLQQELAQ